MRCLVLGAAGFLGLNLVDELRAVGIDPLCARRRRTNVIPLRSRAARLAEVDLDVPDSILAACAGVDVVFHLAGHYPRHSLDGELARTIGLRQLGNVLDAAATAGIRRLVYVSSTATVAPRPRGPSDETDTYPEAPGLGVYHDLKWAMEARTLRERRLDVRVACPGACLGPWDLRVGTSALLVALALRMDPPHPDGIVPIVDVGDAARGILRLGLRPDPPRRALLAGSNHRLHALLVSLAGRYGVRPPGPPLLAEQACAFADAEERRALREGGRAALSREIADLVIHGVPVDAELATRSLDLAWTPLAETLDRFDAWARRMRLIPALENVA